MRYFVVLFAFIIAGCSLFNGQDSEKPKGEIIGTWIRISDSEYQWIGKESKSKKKTDTIILESPEHTLLKIGLNDTPITTNEIRVDFTYADSTINATTIAHDSIKVSITKIYLKGVQAGARPFRINKRIPSVNDEAFTLHVQFLYTCGMIIDGSDNMQIDMYHSLENLAYSKVLQTAGFQQVLEQQFCTTP